MWDGGEWWVRCSCSECEEEHDFELIEPVFFSASKAGGTGPSIAGDSGRSTGPLQDANDSRAFAGLDAIVTCQGGDWTTAMYPKIRAEGWDGYWIDAAKTLRMNDDAVIILDPVNRPSSTRRSRKAFATISAAIAPSA